MVLSIRLFSRSWMSVRSSLWDLPALPRGSRCGLQPAGNTRWPFPYFPWRRCRNSGERYPRVGCWLSATGGAMRSTGHCFYRLSPQWDTTRQKGSRRVCALKKSAHIRLTRAKDMLCVQLLRHLFIARTNSIPNCFRAVMPKHSSKIKQPFGF